MAREWRWPLVSGQPSTWTAAPRHEADAAKPGAFDRHRPTAEVHRQKFARRERPVSGHSGPTTPPYPYASGAVNWKDLLKDYAAWDTLIWFGAIISLASGLTDLGFIKWMTTQLSGSVQGYAWMTTFVVLGVLYIYVHYAFATASGHVAALYVPIAAAAIAAGAPPMMVAICFGIFSNLMWGNTEYGGGPGPIYFGQGYFERPRFYRINFIVVTTNVVLTFAFGLAWWKFLGYY